MGLLVKSSFHSSKIAVESHVHPNVHLVCMCAHDDENLNILQHVIIAVHDLSVKKAKIMLVENLVLYTVINHNTGIWAHMLSMMTYQMLIGEVLHKGSVKVRWTFSLGSEVV